MELLGAESAARCDWVSQDGRCPNLKFLVENVVPASHQVPVSRCDERYFNSQRCSDMPFGEYLDYFHSGEEQRRHKYYLKDWHFHKEFPAYEAYRTPAYFCSDWLNEFLDSQGGGSDYRDALYRVTHYVAKDVLLTQIAQLIIIVVEVQGRCYCFLYKTMPTKRPSTH